MIEIKIDGKTCTCEKGEYLLQVAKRNGIKIPGLCYHESISEQACCRLCIVEVFERGVGKIVVSCVYPVEGSMEVFTNNDRVRENRSVILMLLAARAPDSPEIAALCEEYNAMDGSRFVSIDAEKCIMCGLCVKACESLGTGAISTVGRGIDKKISTPFNEPSKECIGCLSCVEVCPTNAIRYEETSETRTIWGRTDVLVHCAQCDAILGTKSQLAAIAERTGQGQETLCPDCKRKKITDVMAHTFN